MTLITMGSSICNDTPRPFSDTSVPDGLYNGVLCRSEDEARGVCSRDLVQLSQNLELILSPGRARLRLFGG